MIVQRSTEGSSPLARGLRLAAAEHEAIDRIIPARAGFTSHRPGPSHRAGDHPRSRGVYVDKAVNKRRMAGSSPLARGLRGGGRGRLHHGRIIPARAGFTPVHHERRLGPADHPRSRGVYRETSRSSVRARGSSPLARGLPQSPVLRPLRAGIIPARAGFTRCQRSPRYRSRDHPRSRGVYSRWRTSIPGGMGSSPLARGLRLDRLRGRAGRRIIPARAGFTPD